MGAAGQREKPRGSGEAGAYVPCRRKGINPGRGAEAKEEASGLPKTVTGRQTRVGGGVLAGTVPAAGSVCAETPESRLPACRGGDHPVPEGLTGTHNLLPAGARGTGGTGHLLLLLLLLQGLQPAVILTPKRHVAGFEL